jgi:hypothetical protein
MSFEYIKKSTSSDVGKCAKFEKEYMNIIKNEIIDNTRNGLSRNFLKYDEVVFGI